jgi:hypothetical protein
MEIASHPRVLAASQLGMAGLLLTGIWAALPARWWPVDVIGSSLAAIYALAAVGVLLGQGWGRLLSHIAAWVALLVGAATVTALALVVSHLSGLYGPVGAGGALLMGTIAALVLPYLVGLPVLQLGWLSSRDAS